MGVRWFFKYPQEITYILFWVWDYFKTWDTSYVFPFVGSLLSESIRLSELVERTIRENSFTFQSSNHLMFQGFPLLICINYKRFTSSYLPSQSKMNPVPLYILSILYPNPTFLTPRLVRLPFSLIYATIPLTALPYSIYSIFFIIGISDPLLIIRCFLHLQSFLSVKWLPSFRFRLFICTCNFVYV